MWLPANAGRADRSTPITSVTHPLRVDALTRAGWKGRLAMSQLPGKRIADADAIFKRSMDKDIETLKEAGVNLVVSLIEPWEYDVTHTAALPTKLAFAGIQSKYYPIVDRQIPTNMITFDVLVREILDALAQSSGTVLVHCKSGVGRTGLTVASVLVRDGMTAREGIETVQATREGTLTNDFQQRFVEYYETFVFPERVVCPLPDAADKIPSWAARRGGPWVPSNF